MTLEEFQTGLVLLLWCELLYLSQTPRGSQHELTGSRMGRQGGQVSVVTMAMLRGTAGGFEHKKAPSDISIEG